MSENQRVRPRVLYVVTSSLSAVLMRGQLSYLKSKNFDIFLTSDPGPRLTSICEEEQVKAMPVAMSREISLYNDVVALFRLWRLMRRISPAITNVSTPKAGLLGGVAAFAARVPCRIYTLRGLRWETTTGLKRKVLMAAEWIACHCAHQVVCVSHNLRHAIVTAGLVSADRAVVFGDGSSNGVDHERFAPTERRRLNALSLRKRLGIEPHAPVLGFVGRITRDKGIRELYRAHKVLRREFRNLRLLLVGEFEEGDPVSGSLREAILADPSVVLAGVVEEMSDFYQVVDILVHPSYREGFPNVVLEAQAAQKPVVGARVTGTADAILSGITGLLVPVGNVDALTDAIASLLRNPEYARKVSIAARERTIERYNPLRIWEALASVYVSLLQQKGLILPESDLPLEEVSAASGQAAGSD